MVLPAARRSKALFESRQTGSDKRCGPRKRVGCALPSLPTITAQSVSLYKPTHPSVCTSFHPKDVQSLFLPGCPAPSPTTQAGQDWFGLLSAASRCKCGGEGLRWPGAKSREDCPLRDPRYVTGGQPAHKEKQISHWTGTTGKLREATRGKERWKPE